MTILTLRKINQAFLFVIGLGVILHYGISFLATFVFSIFLTMLMEPVAEKLEKWGLGNILSSCLCTLILFVSILGLILLISAQVMKFREDFPVLKDKAQKEYHKVQHFIDRKFGIEPERQNDFLRKRTEAFRSALERQVKTLVTGFFSLSFQFFMALVYTFLLLLKRGKYEEFLHMFIRPGQEKKSEANLHQARKIAHQYLWGRIQVAIYLGILNIIAFSVFNVRHALLLTIFASILSIIPYLGSFLGGVAPMIFGLLTMKSVPILMLFFLVVLAIQLIESYIFEPIIIGNSVRLSPMAIIIAIIIGDMAWGITGMILFIPLLSIIRIFADQVPPLRPLAFLVGDTRSATGKFNQWVERLFRKKSVNNF